MPDTSDNKMSRDVMVKLTNDGESRRQMWFDEASDWISRRQSSPNEEQQKLGRPERAEIVG